MSAFENPLDWLGKGYSSVHSFSNMKKFFANVEGLDINVAVSPDGNVLIYTGSLIKYVGVEGKTNDPSVLARLDTSNVTFLDPPPMSLENKRTFASEVSRIFAFFGKEPNFRTHSIEGVE